MSAHINSAEAKILSQNFIIMFIARDCEQILPYFFITFHKKKPQMRWIWKKAYSILLDV